MDPTELLLEEWKVTKDRISHFDEIVIRLRLEGISLALLIIGIGFMIVQYAPTVHVTEIDFSAAGLVFIFASAYLIPIFFFDMFHYHLLIKSVEHSIWIENQIFPGRKSITQKLTSKFLTTIHSILFIGLYLIIISMGFVLGYLFH
jgi:hypothetical protein